MTVGLGTRSMKHSVTGLIFVLCALCVATESYRILAIVATPSYSHQIPFWPLWLELHERGHEVVLVTSNPISGIQSPNFTQIDISNSFSFLKSINFVQRRLEGQTWPNFVITEMFNLSESFATCVFEAPEMKKLYAPGSGVKFDVLLTELLYAPSLFALGHRFNIPTIALSTMGVTNFNEFVLGGLVLPSHESTWEIHGRKGTNVPFIHRLSNFIITWHLIYKSYYCSLPAQQEVAERYLGPVPPLLDMVKNISAFFVDQSEVFAPARPKLGNVITFASFHIEKNPAPLPKDLQKFIDGADAGFIYFSLGSNARSADLPVQLRRMFCDVFSKLPYRVVWKFETDLDEKPANVYAGKWFSQQKILAHPNVKLFITQGGLQSTEETIYFGVPTIVFPVMADQDYVAERMVTLGIGKHLELDTVTKEEFENTIVEIITDKEYKRRMMRIQNLTKDKPFDLVKNLAWWTEYVVRSEGAPHLRSSLAWQPWYQYCDMDIVVFLAIIIFFVVSKALILIVKLTVYSYKMFHSCRSQKQKIS